MQKTEKELALLFVELIKSQQPKFTIQGAKLVGESSNGDKFELQLFNNITTNQITAISR